MEEGSERRDIGLSCRRKKKKKTFELDENFLFLKIISVDPNFIPTSDSKPTDLPRKHSICIW